MTPAPILLTTAAAVAATIAFAAYATQSAESQLCGPTLVSPPLPTQLALTFDDGPNPRRHPRPS